nr:HNH endonuclease [Clostridium tyrobutyricum]
MAIDELIKENKILFNNEYIRKVITIPEEITEKQSQKLKEGAKYRIIINAYERNPKAKKECIEYYKKLNNGRVICQICGFDFESFYGKEVEGRINVHHLKPLHEIGEEYEIDAINDLIPVCPNCHLVIHSRESAYTPNEVKRMIKNRNLNKNR